MADLPLDSLPPIEALPELHLDNQLCFSLYSLSRRVTQSYTPLLKPLGLTYPQYLVMLLLWQEWEQGDRQVTISYLTERLKLDTGTVTPLLKRMEGKGLLMRQRSEEDERKVLVSLTTQGCELRAQASSIPNALLCQSEVDVQPLLELRDKLNTMLALLSK